MILIRIALCEDISMCLLATHMSLEKCLIRPPAHFLNWVVWVFHFCFVIESSHLVLILCS